jgi:hypothetical protein
MSQSLGPELSNQKILPILNELLKDESINGTTSEVKLNVINGLIKVSQVIGPDILQ